MGTIWKLIKGIFILSIILGIIGTVIFTVFSASFVETKIKQDFRILLGGKIDIKNSSASIFSGRTEMFNISICNPKSKYTKGSPFTLGGSRGIFTTEKGISISQLVGIMDYTSVIGNTIKLDSLLLKKVSVYFENKSLNNLECMNAYLNACITKDRKSKLIGKKLQIKKLKIVDLKINLMKGKSIERTVKIPNFELTNVDQLITDLLGEALVKLEQIAKNEKTKIETKAKKNKSQSLSSSAFKKTKGL